MVRRTAHGGPNPSGEKGKKPSGDAVPAPRLAATGPTPLRTPPHGRRRQTRGPSQFSLVGPAVPQRERTQRRRGDGPGAAERDGPM